MADNYLEKHYAEYEARKAAWKQGGSHRSNKALSIVSLSALYLPSVDFPASVDFYTRYFGFVSDSDHTLTLPNSTLFLILFQQKNTETIRFQFKIVSKYQFDQLILRLKEDNVSFSESDLSITDPSGNIIDIKM